MCHDEGSRPPDPPRMDELGSSRQLVLRSADGTPVSAFEALPKEGSDAGIVILPDVRGLHPYYVALAERFAMAGLPTIAIDYFGRQEMPGIRAEPFDWQSLITKVKPEHVEADVAPAVERLRERDGVRSVFTVGFCFGGGQSWRLSASDLP